MMDLMEVLKKKNKKRKEWIKKITKIKWKIIVQKKFLLLSKSNQLKSNQNNICHHFQIPIVTQKKKKNNSKNDWKQKNKKLNSIFKIQSINVHYRLTTIVFKFIFLPFQNHFFPSTKPNNQKNTEKKKLKTKNWWIDFMIWLLSTCSACLQ